MRKAIKIFSGLVVISVIILPTFAFAQDSNVQYNLIQPLPGVQSVPDFPTFLYDDETGSGFIPFLLGLAGLLSLIQIIRGGIMRAVSGGNSSAISDANDMIWQAILGLVLALSGYLILSTINPDLVNLRFAPLDIRIAPSESGEESLTPEEREMLGKRYYTQSGCEEECTSPRLKCATHPQSLGQYECMLIQTTQ